VAHAGEVAGFVGMVAGGPGTVAMVGSEEHVKSARRSPQANEIMSELPNRRWQIFQSLKPAQKSIPASMMNAPTAAGLLRGLPSVTTIKKKRGGRANRLERRKASDVGVGERLYFGWRRVI